MPCRPLKLIIYHSPLFSAHWSLFIPSIQDSNIGKRIHVVGDSLNGFTHEFVRNENLEDETRSYSLIDIGEVDAEIVADAAADTGRDSEIRDAAAVDELERLALEVPAPMKTLRAAADVVSSAYHAGMSHLC